MTKPLHSLVFVEWYDAVTSSDGWANSKEDFSIHRCRSVGWLIKETRREIILAADNSDTPKGQDGCDVNRRIAIPKSWITSKRKLKVPSK